MLNVWHLVAYQRYYDGLISATGGSHHSNQHRPTAQLNAMGSNIVDVSGGRGWGCSALLGISMPVILHQHALPFGRIAVLPPAAGGIQ